ncbi:MAG TPA: PAS domain S-box protein [Planctomycetota bacterium]|jgi:PAS domain S-box-containing protein
MVLEEGTRAPLAGAELGAAGIVRSGARVLIVLLLVIGVLDLVGWLFGLPLLCSFAPGLIGMKPNAAVCFLLLGIALWLLWLPTAGGHRRMSAALAATTLAIGLLNVCEYVFHWSAGIDQLLVQDREPVLSNVPAGRLAMAAAGGVVLGGATLLFMSLGRGGAWRMRVLVVCGSLLTLIGLFSPTGYTVADPALVGWWRATAMALPTSISLVLVGASILLLAWQEARENWTAGKGIVLAFALTVVVLSFVSVSSFMTDHDLTISYQAAQTSQTVLHKTQAVLLEAIERETAWRGFLVTGNREFLGAPLRSTKKLREDMEELRRLTARNSSQQEHTAALGELLDQWIAQFNLWLNLRADRPAEIDSQIALTLQGKDTMDRIRAAIADIERIEKAALLQRETAVHAAQQKAFFLAPLGDAFAYLALVAGLIILLRDINARRRAESALRESEERYRTLFSQAPDNLMLVDPQTGKVLDCNDAACAQLGYSREELLKLRVADFDAAQTGEEIRLNMHSIMRSKHADFETRYRTKQGEIRDIRMTVRVTELSGRPVLLGISRDITERKRAAEALQQSEARLSAIIASAMDAIITVDNQQRIILFNGTAERAFGCSAADAIGTPVSRFIPERFRHVHEKHIPTFATSAIRELRVGDREPLWALRPDGTEFPMAASISKTEAGGQTLFMIIARDVTKQRQLEQQFLQAQKMEAVGQLAGGVAHDFNNLLCVINGRAELALESMKPNDSQRRNLELIFKTGERAAKLTRQLLAFSRRQVLQPKVLDLNAVVADIDEMLRRLVPEDITVTTDLAPELHHTKADPSQVEQVIMNLVVNARDAMAQGGTLTIKTADVELDEAYCSSHAGAQAGKYVMLSVSDTGCGMDDNVKKHLFEPFFTTKGRDRGTGLGLATTYGIVKQSGGYITAESELGKGTTFKVYLPQVAEGPIASAERAAVGASHRGKETILLVEDEEEVRLLASDILEAEGYRVFRASGGLEALQVYEEHHDEIRIVVTDVIMPQLTGPELAARLRLRCPDIRVVYISGYTDDAVRVKDLSPGTHFIQKPFAASDLLRKVQDVLDGK